MDLASMPAYSLPLFIAVRARVAMATAGAAPNNPAKLLGFNRSPSRAKAETTNPPMITRKRISFNRSLLRTGLSWQQLLVAKIRRLDAGRKKIYRDVIRDQKRSRAVYAVQQTDKKKNPKA